MLHENGVLVVFRSRSVCYRRTGRELCFGAGRFVTGERRACELCFGAGRFVTAERRVSCVSEQVSLLQQNSV